MRDASVGLIARMAAGSNSLARLWKITPPNNGTVKRFTDHDDDITIDDGTYKSSASCIPMAVETTAGRGVTNSSMNIVFTGDSATGLDRTSLINGSYDESQFQIYLVDWQYPEYGTMTIMSGLFGSMTADDNLGGSVSLSGLLSRLDRILGERYSGSCRADFGDFRCKIDLDGGLAARYATAVLTGIGHGGFFSASKALAGETVTVGSVTYTFRASVSTTANEVKLGKSFSDDLFNLVAAVNLTAGSGTLYGSATVANPDATAVRNGLAVTFTARASGTVGNSLASTETMSHASFGGSTFSGGVDTSPLKSTATVSVVTSNGEISVTPDTPMAAGLLTLGVIVWDSATSNSGSSMEILVDTPGSGSDHHLVLALGMAVTPLVGDTVTVFAGCDKEKTTCDVKYNNLINMRAEPGIPGSDAQQTVA